MGSSGLEPPTSRLSGVCSNLLSYEPIPLQLAAFGVLRFLPTLGGDERNRTADPLLARQVLSQLSYTPILNRIYSRICSSNGFYAVCCSFPFKNISTRKENPLLRFASLFLTP